MTEPPRAATASKNFRGRAIVADIPAAGAPIKLGIATIGEEIVAATAQYAGQDVANSATMVVEIFVMDRSLPHSHEAATGLFAPFPLIYRPRRF